MKKQTIIKAKTLYDGKSRSEDKYIIIENDKIIDVTGGKKKADFEGFVTPGFIDPHSHIGMVREGEPGNEAEVNDTLDQILPTINPLNSIYFDDSAFAEAIDFGVLYSCVIPGSGNLMGGKAKVIRNFAKNIDDAEILDYGYKMALGFNPRSTGEWKGVRPNTRMGVYAHLESQLDQLIHKKEKALHEKEKKLYQLEKTIKEKKLSKTEQKKEKDFIEKEYELTFTTKDKAILEILEGKKTAKIHVHKDDDVLYLIDFVQKYGIKATADHTCDVFQKTTFDKLAKNSIPVVYGPLGTLGYKVELKNAGYQNVETLMKSKAEYGLMTDHPVIKTGAIRDSLKYFMIYGMDEAEAISLITYKNAKILGIDDNLGTIEKGKTASLVVWNNNPFHLSAFPQMVMGEGKILRRR